MKRRDFLQLAAAAPCVALGMGVKNAFSLENETSDEGGETLRRNVVMRGNMDLQSAIEAFGRGKGDVAFLGGSITEMDGYRPMVCEYLQKTFPKTEFNFVAAGISSTCSLIYFCTSTKREMFTSIDRCSITSPRKSRNTLAI